MLTMLGSSLAQLIPATPPELPRPGPAPAAASWKLGFRNLALRSLPACSLKLRPPSPGQCPPCLPSPRGLKPRHLCSSVRQLQSAVCHLRFCHTPSPSRVCQSSQLQYPRGEGEGGRSLSALTGLTMLTATETLPDTLRSASWEQLPLVAAGW